jgi:AP-1 complex subunit mu
MSYRLSQNVKPLVWVECLVENPSRSRTDYVVKARSQFKERWVSLMEACAGRVEAGIDRAHSAFQSTCKPTKFQPPPAATNRIQTPPPPPPKKTTSSAATNVEIILPLPPDAIVPQSRCSQGSAAYVPEKNAMVWTIKSFPGGKVGSSRREVWAGGRCGSVALRFGEPAARFPVVLADPLQCA